MMTPRQSVEAVLKGDRPDRVPFTIYENKLPRCAVERRLRNDGLCVVDRSVPVYDVFHPNVKMDRHTYVENGKTLTHTVYHTPHGELYTLTEPAGFTTWTHKHLFTHCDEYKRLHFFLNDAEFTPNYEAFRYAEEADSGDSFFRPTIGWEPMQELIASIMGPETFCMEWFDHQDEILKLYDILVEKRRRVYRLCADSPGTAFNYGGNVTPEILGLARFERYYVPNYNEAAEVLHQKGKLIGVHFDANCALLAHTIADLKLDYIEAFTPAPDTDMTLRKARQSWPDKVLWINFPSSIHLEDVETIRATTHELMHQVSPRDKFIMGITEDIPEARWRSNLTTISEALKQY